MTRFYVIRHGEAASGWGEDANPPLSEMGRAQAAKAAENIEAHLSAPVPIISSPLLRCQQTAQALAERWQQNIEIDPCFREIPSPHQDLDKRVAWLRRIMPGSWADLDNDAESAHVDFKGWREGIISRLGDFRDDEAVVIFSHFIVLNVIYAAAEGTSAIVSFRPDNGSLHIFNYDDGILRLHALGQEASTKVN